MKAIFLFCLLLAALTISGQAPEIGIVQDMEQDSVLQAAGYRSLSESIAKCFSPRNLTEEQFRERLGSMQKLRTRMVACNLFIPGDMKLVGPGVDEGAILTFAEKVFQRCEQAKLTLIVWGSGGARRVPEGFAQSEAKVQFVSIARKVAELAKKHHVVLALENLNHTETNFINTLQEALDIVKTVNHPNLRLNVDVYHMLKEDEGPSVIESASGFVVHCEMAEKDKRTPPGTKGDDFREYLRALKKINFKGRIMLECRWDNLALQASPARVALQAQMDTVYK